MARKKIEKDELIARAGYLFRTKGYANTSIADIAQACGLSKASIYHHITSKQELATKVIQHLHENIKVTIFDLAYDTKVSITERTSNFITATHAFFKDREGGCLIANFISEIVDTHPEFYQFFVDFFNEWIAAFTNLLTNKFPLDQAQLIAADIIAQLQGSILLSRLYKNSKPLDRTINAISALFSDEVISYQNLALPVKPVVSEEIA